MPSRAEAIVAGVDAVTLAEVNARASLERRVDRKYILGWDDVAALVEALQDTHVVLEIDGNRTFGYVTEYYDSPSFGSYRAHVQRRRRRFKARVREYSDTGYRRLEVKLKGRRGETVKRWTAEPGDVVAFARETIAREYRQEVSDLARTLEISYRRVTLVARDSAQRITIDYDLRFTDASGREAELLSEFTIVEIKSASLKGAAEKVLRRLGGRPVSVSKYIAGIALLSGRVPNDLRPLDRRYFATVA